MKSLVTNVTSSLKRLINWCLAKDAPVVERCQMYVVVSPNVPIEWFGAYVQITSLETGLAYDCTVRRANGKLMMVDFNELKALHND